MADRWDPFLDAYLEVQAERDRALAIALVMIKHLKKAKQDQFIEEIDELIGKITEREDNNGDS